jgi:hypothetical protein
MDAPRPVPPQLEATFKAWEGQAFRLRIHVSLLVSASVFSILTASDLVARARPFCAVAAALSVGILSALDLGAKANGLRNAWRHMNAAMARYASIPTFTVEQLIQAYEDAETLIGDLPSGPRPAVPQNTSGDPSTMPSSNRPLQPVSDASRFVAVESQARSSAAER